MQDYIWNSDNKKEDKAKIASSDENKNSIEITGNHIYFYNGVDFETALNLNKTLQDLTCKIINNANAWGLETPILHLHINSGGGYIHAGTAIMDTIIRLKDKIDIYTYVEGRSASAATFISCVGTKRFITKNSVMLIHQLAGMMWGKYNELEDEKQNLDLLMDMIKRVYKDNTKVPTKELDKILSHDLYWDSKKCIDMGLVDEIL